MSDYILVINEIIEDEEASELACDNESGSNSPAPPDNQVETPKKHDTEILHITFRQGIRKER